MRPPKQACIRQVIVTVFSLCLLCQTLLIAAPVRTNKRAVHLTSRLNATRVKIRQYRKVLHIKREQAKQTKARLHVAAINTRTSRSSMLYYQNLLTRKKIELKNATIAYQKAQREFANTRREASGRLVALYQRGEPGYLELMLSSEDFGAMLQRTELASYMMEQDRDVLSQLKERKKRLDRYRDQVDQKKREVATLETRAEITVQHNEKVQSSVASRLRQQRAQMDALEAELAALERDSAAVTAMLRAMQQTSSGRHRYNGPRYAVGGLPVAGRISSPFGYRYHPILHYRRLHTGIDIGAPTGTPIHAAGGGQVICASWRGGYGNCIIIDHGGGKATLYGHMSRYNTRAGQTVSKGDIIGFVGSTGMSTGPHLHYEVRINGTPVNPL